MKIVAKFFIIVITLTSCANEVEFNTPSFQGNRDYGLWKAEFMSASIDDNGFLTISAGRNMEKVYLKIPSAAMGIYNFGDVDSMEARYIDADGMIYSTNNRPDPSVSIYPEIGFLNLEQIDNTNVTGNFEFLAFDESGLNAIGFNVGKFFRVPLVMGNTP
jgi:hypothetical protein